MVSTMTASDGGKPTRECAGCGKTFKPKSSRQKYHSPACRKQSQAKKKVEPTPEERVIQWATMHGAPVRMLVGWDPDTGHWADGSPVALMLADIARGAHIVVTGRRYGFHNMTELMFKGSEYSQASEDRTLIPIEIRPLVDLYGLVNFYEAGAEIELSTGTYAKAMKDGRLGIEFLGRRWPSRWREQQQISTADEADERETAVSALISDPVSAMHLAEMADRVENQIEDEERGKSD